jgi:hypothetical protein
VRTSALGKVRWTGRRQADVNARVVWSGVGITASRGSTPERRSSGFAGQSSHNTVDGSCAAMREPTSVCSTTSRAPIFAARKQRSSRLAHFGRFPNRPKQFKLSLSRAGITVNVTSDDRRRSRRSSRIATRRRSTCGAPRSSSLERTAAARPRSCTRSGKWRPVVWTWQARFMAEGDGLTRDKTRKPGRQPPLPAASTTGARSGAGATAGRGDPLDRPNARQGGGSELALGAAHP